MNFKDYAAYLVKALNVTREDGSNLDAGETAAVARQLEYIYTEVMTVKRPPNKALVFCPLDNTVDAGADSFTYYMRDEVGMAQLISDYAGDLSAVDIVTTEFNQKIRSGGDSFHYSIQDLHRASRGLRLDSDRAMVARNRIDALIDRIIALGDTSTNMPGMLNHPNVEDVTVTNGSWLTATAQEILDDVWEVETEIIDESHGVYEPTTLILPTAHYQRIARLRMSDIDGTTVLQHILATSSVLREIAPWYLNNTADGGTNPRGMMYPKRPEVLRAVVPIPFEQTPPQARNLAFLVACHCRIGGVSFREPAGARYLDGI